MRTVIDALNDWSVAWGTLVRVVGSASWGSIFRTSVAVGLDGNAAPPFKTEPKP